MSGDLTWALLNKNNSFLVKRDGAMFSKEANNLMNVHSFKFSGLANAKAVGVTEKDGKITLTKKNAKAVAARKVNKSVSSYGLPKNMANGNNKAASAILNQTDKSFYRKDLAKYAVARYHAYSRAVRSGRKVQKKRPRHSARN